MLFKPFPAFLKLFLAKPQVLSLSSLEGVGSMLCLRKCTGGQASKRHGKASGGCDAWLAFRMPIAAA
jgi:hypothetical protein